MHFEFVPFFILPQSQLPQQFYSGTRGSHATISFVSARSHTTNERTNELTHGRIQYRYLYVLIKRAGLRPGLELEHNSICINCSDLCYSIIEFFFHIWHGNCRLFFHIIAKNTFFCACFFSVGFIEVIIHHFSATAEIRIFIYWATNVWVATAATSKFMISLMSGYFH